MERAPSVCQAPLRVFHIRCSHWTWLCKVGSFPTSLPMRGRNPVRLCDNLGTQIQGGDRRGAGEEDSRPWVWGLVRPERGTGRQSRKLQTCSGAPRKLQGVVWLCLVCGVYILQFHLLEEEGLGSLPWTHISKRTASPVQPNTHLCKMPLGTQNTPDVYQGDTPGKDLVLEAALSFANVSGHQNVAWN